MASIEHDLWTVVNSFEHNLLTEVNTSRVVIFFAMNYRILAGNRIANAREAIKQEDGEPLTQPLLAARVKGLTKTALSNYEQGIRYAPPHMLVGLSAALNEPASYLAGLVEDGPEAELHRAFHKMDDADKEDVLHYVKRRKSLVAEPVQRIKGSEITTKPSRRKTKK
jgi:transcriptional regulator with XRE-family HTH domain